MFLYTKYLITLKLLRYLAPCSPILKFFIRRVTNDHVTHFLPKTTQDKMALPSDYHRLVVGLLLNFFLAYLSRSLTFQTYRPNVQIQTLSDHFKKIPFIIA